MLAKGQLTTSAEDARAKASSLVSLTARKPPRTAQSQLLSPSLLLLSQLLNPLPPHPRKNAGSS